MPREMRRGTVIRDVPPTEVLKILTRKETIQATKISSELITVSLKNFKKII